ncbi:MAG: thiamine pyrophosphate-dependent enzyme [Desulfobacterales bacterium]|jgi:pyruvate ferredoxin oxidoreductase beta subunit
MEASIQFEHDELFVSGHRACPGCGLTLAVRHILEATGPDVIVVTPTGCLETVSSPYGSSPWGVPWIHHVFENGPSVATGVAAALKAKGKTDTRVVAIGGDGSTFDIGFGALSGMLERGDDVLYICTDNAAYGNTGGQCSGATPERAATTTSPAGVCSMGKVQPKKDIPAIIAAHGTPYVATASVGYLKDLQKKVKRAMAFRGPRYIQIDQPCTSVWGFPAHLTMEYARLAVNSGLVPLFEMENGRISKVRKIKKPVPVGDYLKGQKRFAHLFKSDEGAAEIKHLQEIAEANMAKYGLKP